VSWDVKDTRDVWTTHSKAREVKKAHPDAGGTAEMFAWLVKARDRLLAGLGTSAPQAKPPQYAPKGMRMVYRSVRSTGPARLGSTRRLAAT
jgi:hypothetical protein